MTTATITTGQALVGSALMNGGPALEITGGGVMLVCLAAIVAGGFIAIAVGLFRQLEVQGVRGIHGRPTPARRPEAMAA